MMRNRDNMTSLVIMVYWNLQIDNWALERGYHSARLSRCPLTHVKDTHDVLLCKAERQSSTF